MDAFVREDDIYELDESSWVYLSLQQAERENDRELYRGVIEACEQSGWPAVTWSPVQHEKSAADSARFFEGMGHAVAHADVVVVLINGSSAITDAELAFAYRHQRPVVALHIREGGDCRSDVRAMLGRYHRAFTVEGADAKECLAGLRQVLGDPNFGAILHEAATESIYD